MDNNEPTTPEPTTPEPTTPDISIIPELPGRINRRANSGNHGNNKNKLVPLKLDFPPPPTFEELFQEYQKQREEIIRRNIEFLSNNDGKLLVRLKSLSNPKQNVKQNNTQVAGAMTANAKNIKENHIRLFFDLLQERLGTFNKKTLNFSKIQEFMRGLYKKNCEIKDIARKAEPAEPAPAEPAPSEPAPSENQHPTEVYDRILASNMFDDLVDLLRSSHENIVLENIVNDQEGFETDVARIINDHRRQLRELLEPIPDEDERLELINLAIYNPQDGASGIIGNILDMDLLRGINNSSQDAIIESLIVFFLDIFKDWWSQEAAPVQELAGGRIQYITKKAKRKSHKKKKTRTKRKSCVCKSKKKRHSKRKTKSQKKRHSKRKTKSQKKRHSKRKTKSQKKKKTLKKKSHRRMSSKKCVKWNHKGGANDNIPEEQPVHVPAPAEPPAEPPVAEPVAEPVDNQYHENAINNNDIAYDKRLANDIIKTIITTLKNENEEVYADPITKLKDDENDDYHKTILDKLMDIRTIDFHYDINGELIDEIILNSEQITNLYEFSDEMKQKLAIDINYELDKPINKNWYHFGLATHKYYLELGQKIVNTILETIVEEGEVLNFHEESKRQFMYITATIINNTRYGDSEGQQAQVLNNILIRNLLLHMFEVKMIDSIKKQNPELEIDEGFTNDSWVLIKPKILDMLKENNNKWMSRFQSDPNEYISDPFEYRKLFQTTKDYDNNLSADLIDALKNCVNNSRVNFPENEEDIKKNIILAINKTRDERDEAEGSSVGE